MKNLTTSAEAWYVHEGVKFWVGDECEFMFWTTSPFLAQQCWSICVDFYRNQTFDYVLVSLVHHQSWPYCTMSQGFHG
ncbi:hypothetical protein E4U35_000159 [Claviceps purpurea]|nr:hypothetical protein E4U35_000159 [Claviceps purpurea]